MTSPTPTTPAVRVPVLAWPLLLFALLAMYLLLQENGTLLASYAETVHEFTHDGRHALGVPCH
jgi:cobalt transporter subunit CbtB